MQIFFIGTLWKFDGTTLTNKTNIGQLSYNWTVKKKGSLVYIENRSNETVLSVSDNETVNSQKLKLFAQLDAFTPNDTGQMWLKRESNEDGYFILTNPHTQKILTAGSDHHFEIIGNQIIDIPG